MLTFRDLPGPIGCEILGLKAGVPLTAEELAQVNDAFLRRLVLRFRGTPMTPQQLLDFTRVFGEVVPHIAKKYRLPDTPEVVLMTNQDADGNFDRVGAERGVGWHSDLAYDWVPAKATLLHAVAIPDRGGNTKFANMYLAYESLPEPLKAKLEGKLGTFRNGGRGGFNQGIHDKGEVIKNVVHPIIRTHPETGRKSVYANPYHLVEMLGVPRSEGDALLAELFAHCEQKQFQWEQEWQVGDTIMWENRSAWHSGSLDYPLDQLRKFYRTTIRGTPTVNREEAERLMAEQEAA